MLKALLMTLARSNVLVDLAVDVQNQITREAQAAGVALAVAGFGAGVLVSGAVACATAGLTPLDGIGMGVGLLLGIGGGVRVHVARQRLNRLKDLLSARAARQAVSNAASAGVDLVNQGLSAAGSAVGRWFKRDQPATPEE